MWPWSRENKSYTRLNKKNCFLQQQYIVGSSVRKENDLPLSACLILFISSKMSVRASANRESTFNAMFTVDTCFQPTSSFRDGNKKLKFLQKCIWSGLQLYYFQKTTTKLWEKRTQCISMQPEVVGRWSIENIPTTNTGRNYCDGTRIFVDHQLTQETS